MRSVISEVHPPGDPLLPLWGNSPCAPGNDGISFFRLRAAELLAGGLPATSPAGRRWSPSWLASMRSLSASIPRTRCVPGRIPAWVWPSSRPWLSGWDTPPLLNWRTGPSPWGCGGQGFFQPAVNSILPHRSIRVKSSTYFLFFLDFFMYLFIIESTSPSLLSLIDGTFRSIAAEKIQQIRVCPAYSLLCWFLLFMPIAPDGPPLDKDLDLQRSSGPLLSRAPH